MSPNFFVLSNEKLNLAFAAKTSEVKTDVTIILYDAGRTSPARDDRLTAVIYPFLRPLSRSDGPKS